MTSKRRSKPQQKQKELQRAKALKHLDDQKQKGNRADRSREHAKSHSLPPLLPPGPAPRPKSGLELLQEVLAWLPARSPTPTGATVPPAPPNDLGTESGDPVSHARSNASDTADEDASGDRPRVTPDSAPAPSGEPLSSVDRLRARCAADPTLHPYLTTALARTARDLADERKLPKWLVARIGDTRGFESVAALRTAVGALNGEPSHVLTAANAAHPAATLPVATGSALVEPPVAGAGGDPLESPVQTESMSDGPILDTDAAGSSPTTSSSGSDPVEPAGPSDRLAADVLLDADVRNRQTVITELFATLRRDASDIKQCVLMAQAKLAHEQLHPETKHGGAPGKAGGGKQRVEAKDPRSESFVKQAMAGTGWGKTKVSERLFVGMRICHGAYLNIVGSRAANRIGELKAVGRLMPHQQMDVSKDYGASLDRQAKAKLKGYVAEIEKRQKDEKRESDEEGVPTGKQDGDPSASDALAPAPRTVTLKHDGTPDVLRFADVLLKLSVKSVNDGAVTIAYTTASLRRPKRRAEDTQALPPDPPMPETPTGARLVLSFRADAADVARAMDIVSIVPPRPIDKRGNAGFLFVLTEGRCRVYTHDTQHVARAEFVVSQATPGAFIFPFAHVDAFSKRRGGVGVCVFQTADAQGGTPSDATSGGLRIDVAFADGGTLRLDAIHSLWMQACDRALEEAVEVRRLPAGLFRRALRLAAPFALADGKERSPFEALQLFGEHGAFYAADKTKAVYFECAALKGQSLAVHGSCAPLVADFLARCEGDVLVRSGANMTFAIGMSRAAEIALGWANCPSAHADFNYYPLSRDSLVLAVPGAQTLEAIASLKKTLDPTDKRVRFRFDAATLTIVLDVPHSTRARLQSTPVPVTVVEGDTRTFDCGPIFDHLAMLFRGAVSEHLQLRVCFPPLSETTPAGAANLRTVEEFWLLAEGGTLPTDAGVTEIPGAVRCRVTRFAPALPVPA